MKAHLHLTDLPDRYGEDGASWSEYGIPGVQVGLLNHGFVQVSYLYVYFLNLNQHNTDIITNLKPVL